MPSERPGRPPGSPLVWATAELGWNHFSGKHNIKKCALVTIPLRDKVDQVDGANLQY